MAGFEYPCRRVHDQRRSAGINRPEASQQGMSPPQNAHRATRRRPGPRRAVKTRSRSEVEEDPGRDRERSALPRRSTSAVGQPCAGMPGTLRLRNRPRTDAQDQRCCPRSYVRSNVCQQSTGDGVLTVTWVNPWAPGRDARTSRRRRSPRSVLVLPRDTATGRSPFGRGPPSDMPTGCPGGWVRPARLRRPIVVGPDCGGTHPTDLGCRQATRWFACRLPPGPAAARAQVRA